MAPRDENELQHMLKTAIDFNGPIALRYPRGNGYGVPLDQDLKPLTIGKAELLREGADGVLVALGSMVYPALDAAAELATEGLDLSVVNARFVKPLDAELLLQLVKRFGRLVTLEENALQGGFGTAVLELLEEQGLQAQVLRIGYPDQYIEQGEQHELRAMHGLDKEGIAKSARMFFKSP
jgi:1-deoxy-D-xylulose-5-phosphate synthase (EC 2.2.1.7)